MLITGFSVAASGSGVIFELAEKEKKEWKVKLGFTFYPGDS